MRTYMLALAIASLTALAGCATSEGVRYVYQDGDFGVIGIPENTDRWPTRYRTQAEKLMDAHFPEGHEVVRAEEVVEGSRTLKIEGNSAAELTPSLPAPLLAAAKLGHTASRSQSDTVKVKEARIIYRRALRPTLDSTTTEPTFADHPDLTPTQYIDPNAAERRKPDSPASTPGPNSSPQTSAVTPT